MASCISSRTSWPIHRKDHVVATLEKGKKQHAQTRPGSSAHLPWVQDLPRNSAALGWMMLDAWLKFTQVSKFRHGSSLSSHLGPSSPQKSSRRPVPQCCGKSVRPQVLPSQGGWHNVTKRCKDHLKPLKVKNETSAFDKGSSPRLHHAQFVIGEDPRHSFDK